MQGKTRRHYAIFFAVATLLSAISAGASAQSIEHKFKLGLETRIFRFVSVTTQPEGTNVENTSTDLELGIFSSGGFLSATMNSIAIPASTFGADLGYGLTDSVVLGSRLVFDYGNLKDGGDVSAVHFAILPHLDYVFSSNRKFWPLIGAQLGVQIASLSSDAADISGTVFMLGAHIGGHAFVVDALSIDPRLSFLYSFGTAKLDGSKSDVNSISVAILIGISGWI